MPVRRYFCLIAAAALLTLPSCGSKQSQGANTVLVANQRLQGKWRLQTFTPEATLEAPLQGLLAAELGQLLVTFTGSDYTAVGPGINLSGRFTIQSAQNDILNGTFYDQTGVGYRISGQFDGKLFRFHAYDSPWRGSGVLERAN